METSQAEPVKPDPELHEADFADMHLKVGEHLIVQPPAGSEAEPFTVSFIGAFGRVSFLTSLPVVGDKGMWITLGSRFTFRVVHGMYAYAFTAQCLRARSRPFPYAHFAIPEWVKYRQIRLSYRLETRLPVEVTRANGTRTLAILRDISELGAKLELTGMLDDVGAEVTLSIPILLSGTANAIDVSATIRNRSDLDRSIASGHFHYGVSFAPLAAEDGHLLQHFIEHLLAEQLA
ncbi:MAG: flagellar brake protein [Gammaproteobacteria bacterium]|nr:flagellar brake protein [Gammaproteobacteria bacterium]